MFIAYLMVSVATSRVCSRHVRKSKSLNGTQNCDRALSEAKRSLRPSSDSVSEVAASADVVDASTERRRNPSYSVSMRARVSASSLGERKSTEMASRKWSAGLKSSGTGAPSDAKCAEHFDPPSPAYIKRPPESNTS